MEHKNLQEILDYRAEIETEIIDFRKNAIINTYTITAPMVNSKTLRLSNNENYLLGPDYNQVRVLRQFKV